MRHRFFFAGLIALGILTLATFVIALGGASPLVAVAGTGVLVLAIGLLFVAPRPRHLDERAHELVIRHDADEPPTQTDDRTRAIAEIVERIGALASPSDNTLHATVELAVDRVVELREKGDEQVERVIDGLRALHAELVALSVEAGDVDQVAEAVSSLQRATTPFRGLFNPPV